MLVQQTVTVVVVFDDEHVDGVDPRAAVELFEPVEPGVDMVVPVMAKVTSAQPYLGRCPVELEGARGALDGEGSFVVAGAAGRG